ncbi:hypothetical protein GJU39_03940 [Pedobacter petrophilus]|uniref:Uncharacterized protein n=1 Tax=Pedobacter petrophilus TaxID=1908241 RepID=A0A7K0FUZ1_9SPHI|nr:hypothetical protein [Pedobacter petrophilus]MRX75231.1 hypothetical protein [Pedobacter petrophilus]
MASGNLQFLNKRYIIYRLFDLKKACISFSLLLFFTACKVPVENKISSVPVYNVAYSYPKEILKPMQQEYPNLVLIEKSAYAKLFWDFYDKQIFPSVSTTDINNDQKNDFGYIVEVNGKLKVAIAISNGNKYHYWLSPFALGPREKHGVDFCIDVEPAGRTDIVKPATRSLLLQKNGFVIKKLEQDNLILYENEGQITTFFMK